jgi:hypothetical protein
MSFPRKWESTVKNLRTFNLRRQLACARKLLKC